jgi:phosphoribosylformimino-5-aminoimidazole carboxamide ribotide isomerase
MRDFRIIPVLDLMGGEVVHGRAGARETYRPIESPFGAAHDPVAIAHGLIEQAEADRLYIADLDAIQRKGEQADLCCEIKAALPETEVWLDAGFVAAQQVRGCLEAGLIPVIGSECLSHMAQWAIICAAAGEGAVLSLDFDGDGFRGPEMLLSDPKLWPKRIVVMTLGAVGSGAGPDLARFREIARQAPPESELYCAGGIRGIEDLDAAAEAGASGALIATALHTGSLPQKEIAAFRRRRRLSASNTTP